MGIVFINYRRDNTAGEARALFNSLVQQLGAERVFMDVDNIALGRDFREVLRQRLDDCEVMLALIGRGWADARDAAGQRRLEQPNDFVRLEIATALQRNVAVTPVLVQDARMPSADALPDDLKPLAFRNGFEISHQTWDSNVRELVARLGLAPAGHSDAPRSRTPMLAGAAMLAVAAAAGAWFAMQEPPAPPTPTAAATPDTAVAPAPAPASVPPAPAPALPAAQEAPREIPTPAPVMAAAAVPSPSVQALVAALVGPDVQARQDAAATLERDHLRSREAVQAALAYLPYERFQTLGTVAQRSRLLNFLLATEDAAWTPELRAEGARAIASVQARMRANPGGFRAENMQRVDALAARLGA
ncbi:MAG: toll/interleukin-1 receptor domain-containing protein [Piscinibacter sp.]|uniref:TIR domain-containing protein n=1 Tax=Piscinibacter sp. TaxID=1903157 RepID=UPI0025880C4A|nr:TIR domain-containing protein [Piscinibacter sp.]MCW5664129.1 toll/interleukin-1 receptor domain-containing protein [Piscinibacter sp.]